MAWRGLRVRVSSGPHEQMIRKEAPEINEKVILEGIIGGQPQILYVESGGIKPTNIPRTNRPRTNKPYETTSYSDETASGTLGGKARVIAAAEIARVFPDIQIVTSSKDDINSETHAKVMADELINQYGVNKDRITLEENSVSTQTELIEMVKMAIKNNWQSVAVLTNDYHLARNLEMFVNLDKLADPKDEEFKTAWEKFQADVSCVFIGAETILPLRSPRYETLIEKVEETESYKRRLEFEAKGVQALEEKTYKSDPSVNVLKNT